MATKDDKADAPAPDSAPPTAAEKPKLVRKVPELQPDRLELAEYRTARWRVLLPAGLEPNDLLSVAFWANVAHKLGKPEEARLAEIVVATEDMTWYAELIVVDYGANWVKVAFKTTEDGKRLITKLGGLESATFVRLPGHTVNYAGMYAKWRIVRDADGKVLSEKHNTQDEAHAWLRNYAKSLAA